MLTDRELATLRAALLFWREEMPDAEIMAPYFDIPEPDPLSTEEVEDLRAALQPSAIRYGLIDAAAEQLAALHLYRSAAEAQTQADPAAALVTVLLPTA